MSRFFIDRPVFAWVLALVVMLAGVLAIIGLPVEQYPRIAPPGVQVAAVYPGASAQTVADTVTQVIEQKMKGIDHLRYMASTSDSAGNATIKLTFEPEADPDIAQVQVQNKLQLALPLLPQPVQSQGVSVTKSSDNFLLVAGLVSTDGALSDAELSDYMVSRLQDEIARVPGVGDVQVFGAQHAMRIWLDPDRMISHRVTVSDISSAIQTQNAEVSAGRVGRPPAVAGQMLSITLLAQSRLQTPDQFGAILLKVNTDGSQVRLKDVARIEIGSESYDYVSRFNGKPAVGLAIKASTGANALKTADAVRARFADLSPFLPHGVEVIYPYDTTPFVRISIREVIQTLAEAIVLVVLVMLLFLQSWRATLIPAIAVPVVLLGTFGILSVCGFTINTLTMFAMVLAIGLLVDDAIVVVENVERLMREEGLPPKEATRKSMDQITGALIGIALVLSAVFVPMAFFSGSTGAIYRQFSLTLVSAMALSVLVALILTPPLCATLLKPAAPGHEHGGRGFGWFNRGFDRGRDAACRGVEGVLRRPRRFLGLYGLLVAALVPLFVMLPTAFLPDEDQGILMVAVSGPAGSSQQRTIDSLHAVERALLDEEKDSIESVFSVAGFSVAGSGDNSGFAFVELKPWEQRTRPDQSAEAIANRLMGRMAALKDAQVFAFTPPAVIELGNAGGFDFHLQDRGGLGHAALMAARDRLLAAAATDPGLVAVRPNGLEDTPQIQLDIDQEKAAALGLSLAEVNNTLTSAWGSAYVNDFIDQGRVKKVYLQADAPFRMKVGDLERWQVRNATGEMVSFATFSRPRWSYGSPQIERYNGMESREIMGAPAPGLSSGEAMAAIERIAATLPAGIGLTWTGLSYEERLAGSQAPALFSLSILVVFLCLAALYESWSIPFAVILAVPLGVLGAVGSVTLAGLANDVYFQVGLLTTIGLSAKNAILIVEFAKAMHEEDGMSRAEAALTAARQRLRPILMTSMAFLLGVAPLALANGAGSGAQNAIGFGVLGGMASATLFTLVFVPLFFVVVPRRR